MRKSYAGLFVTVMLLVIICCIYGSGVSTVRKSEPKSKTESESTQQYAANDMDTVVIEDEDVPAVDFAKAEAATVSGSILFMMSAILLLVIIAVIVIIATIAASTSTIKF